MSIINKPKTNPDKHRWPDGAIVYQIYPRSYYDSNGDGIGDIPGITQKLDYLQELGVNATWLSPFYPSPMADFGYDVADYCDVDPIFGNLKDMKKLIKEAHKRDIKIIVDLVPNHTSDEHEWFRQSKQSKEDKYSDWYIWRDAKGMTKDGKPIPPNNWIEVLTGGPAWEWVASRQQFYLHSFDVRQPDLNWSNPDVREAIKDAMRFWLDMGVDGFRVDAVQFMAKDPLFKDEPKNPNYVEGKGMRYAALEHPNNHGWPPMYAYLAEMAAVLKETKYLLSPRFMITEAYPDGPNPVEDYLAFYEGMDPDVAAPFNFEGLSLPWKAKPWHDFLSIFHDTLKAYDPRCIASYAFGNHDQHRIVSRIGEPAARSAAVMLLTLPGMAFIYNGDEIGMKNGDIAPEFVQDPGAKGGSGRDPERTPMQWSADANAGFSTAHQTWLPVNPDYESHNVETELANPNSFLCLYKKLTRLRNKSDALRYGDIKIVDFEDKNLLGYIRSYNDESLFTIINFSNKVITFNPGVKLSKLLVSSDANTKLTDSIQSKAKLNPHEAAVFRINKQ